jgi:hypothetical protein
MHLTNYSINRYNSEYKTNNDSGACAGHKWSVKQDNISVMFVYSSINQEFESIVELLEKARCQCARYTRTNQRFNCENNHQVSVFHWLTYV